MVGNYQWFTIDKMYNEWLLYNTNIITIFFSYTMLKTSYIPWNDDVIYVLDHHAKLNFHTANSPEQQSVGKLVTPRALGHIILLRTNKSLLLLLNAVSNKYQYCTTDVVHTHTHTHTYIWKVNPRLSFHHRLESNPHLYMIFYTALPIT